MRWIRRHPGFAFAACLGTLLATLAFLAAHEDAGGQPTLAPLTPFIGLTAAAGHSLIDHVRGVVLACAASILLLIAAALASGWAGCRRWDRDAAFLLVVAFAVGAEVLLLSQRFVWAAALVALALAAAALAPRSEGTSSREATFRWRDVGLLLALVCGAAVLRLFALNRLPDIFEGELASYYLGATNLAGIRPANAGVDGPWAPLGLLFYVPVYLSTKWFGPTVLAIRFSAAAVSLVTLSLLYGLTLMTFGRAAAVCAGLFFAFDPLQIGWGRTDVHPHGFTSWLAILMALASIRAFTTGATRWFVVVMALMALSWHQYPSGQTAVAIPLLMAGVCIATGRFDRLAGGRWMLLLAGLVLWLAGQSMAVHGQSGTGLSTYISDLGTRVAWNQTAGAPSILRRVSTTAGHALSMFGDLVAGVFVELRYWFHQDVFVPIYHFPSRSVSWIVAALVLAAAVLFLVWRRTLSQWTVLAWGVAAVLPALFAAQAYPKRAATLFPALFLAAGAVAGEFVAVIHRRLRGYRWTASALLAVASIGWFCATSYLWFSGDPIRYGIPSETLLATRLADEMRPGTIVIADLWSAYGAGKLTYLLSGVLRDPDRQPVLWYVVDRDRDLRALIADPLLATDYARLDRFYYAWGGLTGIEAAALRARRWTRAVFVLQLGLDTPEKLRLVSKHSRFFRTDADRRAILAALRPACPVETFVHERCNDCEFVVATCALPGP